MTSKETDEQPEALRLADAIDPLTRNGLDNLTCTTTAAELRRLHEVNAELLEALKLADALLHGAHMNATAVKKKVDAALARATGEKA